MRTSIGTTAAGIMMLLAAQASAAATSGEQFVFDWTETSGSHVGLTGMVDLTLGAPSSMSGFFDVSVFDVTSAGGFCGICTPKTENLSSLLFDAATNGLQGDVTGSYVNAKGKTHTFDLSLAPAGTWTFDDTGPGGGPPTVTMGTYKTTETTPVPEPATLALLGLGFLGIGLSRRRLSS